MNTRPWLTRSALALGPLLLTVLGGCASAPVPKEQLAVAESSVQHANTTATSEDAAGDLQIAVAKLASARRAADNQDYVLAKQLAEEADLDAQVAELHAQSVRSHKAAKDSMDAARVLREELNRKNPT